MILDTIFYFYPMSFGSKIIRWYEINKRELPWRKTRNPYFIWLSEIILQQTRVDQGMAYYHRFSEKFPDVKSLARAKEDDVMKLWQGLGYYSRARNLHSAAKQIVNDFNGKFPADFDSLKTLKGVGDYTASAIASFAFNLKHPVVDGNVFRLLSRHFGIETPIDSSSAKKEFTNLAFELMDDFPPAVFNQAIMEFGSKQCKPANPDCETCPLNSSCFAFKKNAVAAFPVKKNKTKITNRYFHYLVIRQKNSFYIRKRNEKDIWKSLHDFPLIESKKQISISMLLQSRDWQNTFGKNKIKLLSVSNEFKHILSHQHIYARFYEIESAKNILNESNPKWKKVTRVSVKKFAVPRLIEKYLDDCNKI